MQKLWKLSLSPVLLLALIMGVGACGNQPPTATPLPTTTPFNMDEMRSLVQEAVADAMPAAAPSDSGEPAITEEQLRALV